MTSLINGKRINNYDKHHAKNTTLRKAVATAILKVSSQATIEAIQSGEGAERKCFEFSRAAGLLAVKKTSDVIPDCHPMPVEFTENTTFHRRVDYCYRSRGTRYLSNRRGGGSDAWGRHHCSYYV